jgi:hypothetical protein
MFIKVRSKVDVVPGHDCDQYVGVFARHAVLETLRLHEGEEFLAFAHSIAVDSAVAPSWMVPIESHHP